MNRHASMNRIYRLIWSQVSNAWVPVAETHRGRGKLRRARWMSGRDMLTASMSVAFASAVHAGAAASSSVAPASITATAHPLGGKVKAGSATITQVGNVTDIKQTSANLTIDWSSFNIGSQATVDFLQPSAFSVAINRIASTSASEIFGHLNANGQVYLINPNGIIFSPRAEVNVGGLVASTLDINNSASTATTRSFSGGGTGNIVNQGSITAANGGYVALLGNRVTNEGVITARLGTVALGAGSMVTLDFNANRLTHVQVDRSTLNNLAANKQLIEADGGLVVMTAGAQRALLASVVNNTGIIEARSVQNHDGTIELLGGQTAGSVHVAGTLDAHALAGGNGGQIETSAAHVEVTGSAKITTVAAKGLTGTWLIDSSGFTVASSNGDVSGPALGRNLSSTNVSIHAHDAASKVSAGWSSGSINVDDSITWGANTKLTLTAANDVNVNGNVTASGNFAGLVIEPNTTNGGQAGSLAGTFNLAKNDSITLSGSRPSLSIAGHSYTVINSLGLAGSTTGTDLQGINGNLSGYYALGSNLDVRATATWNSNKAVTPVYAGFTPLGNSNTAFSGTFDGLGHTIINLSINRPMANGVGLFGYTGVTSVIQNLGLIGGSVIGAADVGALVGANYGKISHGYETGKVSGARDVGGLVGNNLGGFIQLPVAGTITDSAATGEVQGTQYVGGLVGYNHGVVTHSHANGNVRGSTYVGGLLGFNDGNYEVVGAVSNSYATGNVKGTTDVGGLAGANGGGYGASIFNSYAIGSVTGAGNVGGLVGFNGGGNIQYGVSYGNVGSISRGRAAGTVHGTSNVGGLVGLNAAQVSDSYATGSVFGSHEVGGLIGNNGGTFAGDYRSVGMVGAVSGSFATGAVAGSTNVGGLVGLNGLSGGGASTYGIVGTIANSHATGSVAGTGNNVGGLVGYSYGTVNDSYATGNVTGANDVGGLVGSNTLVHSFSSMPIIGISNSFATGNVRGSGNVGGLAGSSVDSSIADSYATGSVMGTANNVGGLVGYSGDNGTGQASISDSYAIGRVSGANSVGGLVGYNIGTVGNSFWDVTTSGRSTSAAGTGLTSTQMQTAASFTGWSIASRGGSGDVWRIYTGHTFPLLINFLRPLTLIGAPDTTVTYNGRAQSGPSTTTKGVLGAAAVGTQVGFYNGYYSTQLGYDIKGGNLTIKPSAP